MQPNDHETEVNVTPLIDVSLVLVVMLLLASPLASESSLSVNAADRASRESQQKERVERVEVRILDETRVRVNRESVSREQLAETLRPLLRGEAPPPVVVACEDGVTHGTFVAVLDEAKRSGAGEIAVTGD
ncbi:MAG TPA: biopolymer transporter ExbD [bacterium]|nr:biopolymer transporter ExbD [bacterium]